MLNTYGLQSTKIGELLQEPEADLGIPKSAMSKILTQDLGIKRVMAKFALHPELPDH